MSEVCGQHKISTPDASPPLAAPFAESAEDILDSAPCGFISTLPDGTIVQVNATFLSWTGQSRATLLAGRRFQDLLTVPGRMFYETHFAPLLRMQGFVKEIACQIERVGREPMQVLVNSSLKLDAGGQPLVIRTIVFDATERAKYEQELRRARDEAQQLAAIVTSSGDAIFSIGLDGIVRTWNPGATRLFGYAEAEAVGRAIDESIVPDDRQAEQAGIYETVRSGQELVVAETLRRRKDGSLVPVEINAAPIRDSNGRVTALSFIQRDIGPRIAADAAQSHSEQLHRIAFDLAPAGMVYFGLNARFTRVNARMCEISGYTADELLEMKISELTHPDDRARDSALLDSFLCGATPLYENEKRYVRKDGGILWVSATARMVTGDAGQQLHGIGVVRDISGRKLAEEARQRSDEQLRRSIAWSPIPIVIHGEDGTILEVSEGWTRFSGYTIQDIPTITDWARLAYGEQQSTVKELIAGLFRLDNTDHTGEFQVRAKDGSLRIWDFYTTPLGFVGPGGQRLLLSTAIDITDRRLAELRLIESESLFRATFENAAIGFAQVGPDGTWMRVNQRLCTIVGYRAEELVTKRFQDITHPDDVDANLRNIRCMFDGRIDTFQMEKRYLRKDGSIVWVDLSVGAVRDGGGAIAYFVSTVADIGARKEAEAHNRLLMSEVNHRAKNLLGVVQAVARQTARSGDPATFVTRLSDRIAGLTESHDLLVRNQWRGVDMADLARGQLAHFQGLSGTRVLLAGPPARLNPAAAQGIGMALHELATNAGKYGALSNSDGRVRIGWDIVDMPEPAFTVHWLEEDGPEVVPPGRSGFGQTVIVRMAEHAVDGAVELDYRSTGLSWRLTAPLARVLET